MSNDSRRRAGVLERSVGEGVKVAGQDVGLGKFRGLRFFGFFLVFFPSFYHGFLRKSTIHPWEIHGSLWINGLVEEKTRGSRGPPLGTLKYLVNGCLFP